MSNIIYTPFLNYLRIASLAHERMVAYIDENRKTSLDEDTFEHTADGQATIVVLYAAISLECFIHNYASRNLGENYCKKHIEAMSLHSKWLLIPKLVTGKSISADNDGIALLQKLVKARNSVAHAKAVNLKVDTYEQQKKRIIENNRLVLEGALRAFECAGKLGQALSELDPNEPGAKLLAAFLEVPKYTLQRRQD